MVGATILTILLIALLFYWNRKKVRHDRLIDNINVRIHVNGTRGKSTVTRLVAGVLREAGIPTLAKTTGSAAKVIDSRGIEQPIPRSSAPTIMEQVQIIQKHADPQTKALVVECMALRPQNQRVSQEVMVKGNIGIITNVREDHQEVMGETLPEIADTLALMIPHNGILITAEDRAFLRQRLHQHASERNTEMIYADPEQVTAADLGGFSYLSFRENVAIGLEIARLLGIPREIAIRGMWHARPDVGVVDIQRVHWQEKEIIWAPLFAVNDRESVVLSVESLAPYQGENTTRIGILNNRYDRAKRALEFAKIAAEDLSDIDWFLTFGAYEEQVISLMVEHGYPVGQIIRMGDSVNPTLEQILDTVAGLIRGEEGILIGMVNIHTPQAELLMEFFHEQPDAPLHSDEAAAGRIYRPHLEQMKERLRLRVENGNGVGRDVA